MGFCFQRRKILNFFSNKLFPVRILSSDLYQYYVERTSQIET